MMPDQYHLKVAFMQNLKYSNVHHIYSPLQKYLGFSKITIKLLSRMKWQIAGQIRLKPNQNHF